MGGVMEGEERDFEDLERNLVIAFPVYDEIGEVEYFRVWPEDKELHRIIMGRSIEAVSVYIYSYIKNWDTCEPPRIDGRPARALIETIKSVLILSYGWGNNDARQVEERLYELVDIPKGEKKWID